MLSAKASSRLSVLAWKTPLREGLFTDRLSQWLQKLNNARGSCMNQPTLSPTHAERRPRTARKPARGQPLCWLLLNSRQETAENSRLMGMILMQDGSLSFPSPPRPIRPPIDRPNGIYEVQWGPQVRIRRCLADNGLLDSGSPCDQIARITIEPTCSQSA